MRFEIFTAALLGAVAMQGAATAAPVILNEYNGVGAEKHLDTDTFAGSTKTDTRLGRILGNGKNWFELAVVGTGAAGSTVDMRGWQLRWAETDTASADQANGTDIWYGNGAVEQGVITLTNDTFWSNVTAGTLLTFGQEQAIVSESGAAVVNGSSVGLNFAAGDNWAHIHTYDTAFVTTTTNVIGDGAGDFSVGNDNWRLVITDALGNVVFGPAGEGIPSSTSLNSNEVFKLEANATTSILPNSANEGTGYNDGTSSSFGAANTWASGASSQDFAAFGVAVPEPGTLALLMVGGVSLLARRRA